MGNNINSSQLKGSITFIDKVTPKISAGDYKIEVYQHLEIKDKKDCFDTTQTFSIYGERFELNNTQIHALFPPQGNIGKYSSTFPYISLKKASLPYERSSSLEEENEKKSWLALLLFDEDDSNFSTIWSIDKKFFIRNYYGKENEENSEAKEILELLNEKKIIKSLKEDLIYEIDVKEIHNIEKVLKEKFKDNTKEIVKKTLHIFNKAKNGQLLKLSDMLELQSKFGNTPIFPQFELEKAQKEEDLLKVIDIKLSVFEKLAPKYEELNLLIHSRRAKIEEEGVDETHTIITANRLPKDGSKHIVHLVSFENLFTKEGKYTINNSFIRLVSLKEWNFSCIIDSKRFENILTNLSVDVLKSSQSESISKNRDLILLPHKTRSGGKTISYYRSPLISGSGENTNLPFPAKSADALLIYDPKTGMLETQYATAYEMGKLLTLKTPKVAFEILSWKKEFFHKEIVDKELEKNNYLSLPTNQNINKIQVPKGVVEWFDDLFVLKYVPFSLLVPYEKMLPKESIRFFQIDPLWLEAFLDGAFSVGRVTDKNAKNDEKMREIANLISSEFSIYTGFLIRSEVVAGWPDIDIIATNKELKEDEKLPSLRMERLSKEIMICIFEGEVTSVDIFLKPEGLHFGVYESNGEYYNNINKDLKIPFREDRVIDIQTLLQNENIKNSAEYSLQMIQKAPRVKFKKDKKEQ